MAKKEEAKPMKVKQSECPWCNYENDDESKGPAHEKEVSTLIEQNGGRYQCSTCGKNWRAEALGKAWSIELERGPVWAREARARELRGV